MMPWTDEKIAQQFRLEVQQRFEAENEAYLRQEREEIAEIKVKLAAQGRSDPDWLVARNSFLWEIYNSTRIQIERNVVTAVAVIVSPDFAIYTDFVEMFGGTSVSWSEPSIGAVIVDGKPHVKIELILVDSWDDERHSAWVAEKAAKER